MSLMMHIAEHHAHELFRLSHLAAAEAPLPPSLEWGRANKAQFPDAPRKTWAMQDQASQVCAGGEGRQGTIQQQLHIARHTCLRSCLLGSLKVWHVPAQYEEAAPLQVPPC